MFLLTTDTFKPSGYSCKTCRIVFTSHVYGLTFISGGSGGGWSYTTESCQVRDCFAICECETSEYFKETTGQFPANTAPLWWAVLSAAVWQALMREQKVPFSDFIDLQNIMRQSPQTCSKCIYGNLIWLFEKEHSWFTTKQTDCVTPPDHIHGNQDLEESLSSVDFGGGGDNIGMPSFPQRQSQPPKTIRFLSHYRSHSLRFSHSPLLSPEVSDTEMGNNQKSAQETSNSRFLLYAPSRSFQRGGCNPNVYFPSAKVFWLTTQSLTRLALFLICPRTVVPPGHRQNPHRFIFSFFLCSS